MSADAGAGAAKIRAPSAAAMTMDTRVMFGSRVFRDVVFTDADLISRSLVRRSPIRNPDRTVATRSTSGFASTVTTGSDREGNRPLQRGGGRQRLRLQR